MPARHQPISLQVYGKRIRSLPVISDHYRSAPGELEAGSQGLMIWPSERRVVAMLLNTMLSGRPVQKEVIATSPCQELLKALQTTEAGLSSAEAAARAAVYGPNRLTKDHPSALRILGRQFQSALISLLLGASGIAFLLRDVSDGLIIALILLINASLGFLQEYRSERAVEQLSAYLRRRVMVRRAGALLSLDETQLVPGDILVVKEGDLVSADAKLLTAEHLLVNESHLTGESVAVPKSTHLEASEEQRTAASLLFAGSTIEQGEGIGVVYAIGDATELGQLATLSRQTRKITPYEQSLRSFSAFLMRVTMVTLLLLFVTKLLITHDVSQVTTFLLFILALAIAVVPEALPVITTLTLTRGTLQLAEQNIVVKRLSALEDWGQMTLLCTDKTGTLTENRMSVLGLLTRDERLLEQFAAASIEPAEGSQQHQGSYDQALAAFLPAEVQERGRRFRLLREVPFDPEARRRRLVLWDTVEQHTYLVVIGAVETLLALAPCPDGDEYLHTTTLENQQGIRHLALAYREVEYAADCSILDQERHLTFLGCVKFFDPLKPSAKAAVALAERLGVSIKILTGDSPGVAEYIGRQIGLVDASHPVSSGADLEAMSSEEVKAALANCHVFARVTPQQKYTLIRVLKERHIVGYQGDGINDAPALKLADVAVAVDTATDVAKANADIILLEKDLHVLVKGIKTGREIFVNIRKYISYTMVGNFGNFFALGALYLLSMDLPLLPVQLLLTSLITDLPLLTISSDTVDPDAIARPQRDHTHGLMFLALVLGTLTALVELLFFASIKRQVTPVMETSLFVFLSLLQLVVIVAIRNRGHWWQAKRPSLLLSSAMVGTALCSMALPYIPLLARLFSFTPLPVSELGIILAIICGYVFLLDLVKVWFFRLLDQGQQRQGPSQARR